MTKRTRQNATYLSREAVQTTGASSVLASKRIEQAFTLIEVEWAYARALAARRMWIDILKDQIRSHR